MLNIKLLLKVKEQILKEPRQFDMQNWFQKGDESTPNCGTIACIAGWAIAIDNKLSPLKANTTLFYDTKTEAMRLLGITSNKLAAKLFFESCWPDELRHLSQCSKPFSQERVNIAALAIDDFIKNYKDAD